MKLGLDKLHHNMISLLAPRHTPKCINNKGIGRGIVSNRLESWVEDNGECWFKGCGHTLGKEN